MFSACNVPLDSNETELGSHNQEASPSAGKITEIVLVPCCTCKFVPTAISGDVDTSRCSLLQQTSSVRESQKLLQRLVSHKHQAYLSDFYLIFDSVKWPY